jgi:hypothetical protein
VQGLTKMLKNITVAGFVAAAAVALLLLLRKEPAIPPVINKEASFVIFYPGENSQTKINKETFKYNTQAKNLSFIVSYANKSLTFSEQSTPEGFVDIPQAYDKLIESLRAYASFDSFYGKVDLTHPKEFSGQQSAVMNSKGTLIFVHPTNGSLSTDQWKQLFNNMNVTK